MALAWVGLMAGGTACGAKAPRPIERPVVSVRDAVLDGNLLRVDLSAVNPNGTSLECVAADWEIYEDLVARARGRAELRVLLPARGTVELRVEGRVPPAGIGPSARIEGVLHWYSDAGDVATPFVSPPAYAGR
jgi:hypothetical protein